MKVLSGCAMLESRDDPIPGPRGGGQSGAGEARGGSVRTMSDLILKTNPVGKRKPAKNTSTVPV